MHIQWCYSQEELHFYLNINKKKIKSHINQELIRFTPESLMLLFGCLADLFQMMCVCVCVCVGLRGVQEGEVRHSCVYYKAEGVLR